MSSGDVDGNVVSLTVPGRPEYLRLVRLAAADCGARADFSIEEVEDLRIGVDELAYALIGENNTNGALTLRYAAAPGVVEIEGTCRVDGVPAALTELSQSIIGAVVDEHEIVDEEAVRRFRLVKRRRT